MTTTTNENEKKTQDERDKKREQTNQTDPQLTELKGFTDPAEPLEEKGTPNPLLGRVEGE